MILCGYFLRPKYLLDRDWITCPTLHCGVVGGDHALNAMDSPDTGDTGRARRLAPVHVPGCQSRELEKRRAVVQQQLDAIARKQLAASNVPGAGAVTSSLPHLHLP